jgi:excinuclease UvrABC ATPase subunit
VGSYLLFFDQLKSLVISLQLCQIYAEGQRRYVESLSAYARQFLGQMDKPDVDTIEEPESPVITINLSLGNSISTPFKLCALAPFTTMDGSLI